MIDTVPLPEKVVKGRLSQVRSKFILTAGRRKVELPVGPMLTAREAKGLLGKDLAVAFSAKRPGVIAAIGKWPVAGPRCYFILCYFPLPDLMKRLDEVVRLQVLAELQRQKIVSPELAGRIEGGLRA